MSTSSTIIESPPPKFQEIGNVIAMLLLESKTQGHDQETTRAALSAFAQAVSSTPLFESPVRRPF